ncbi:hypothetical protein PFICI_05791 [Pestalotiopsis fici W106-1]|uniref:Uncharacterized protein n=1 Tax=Pestalotiopsis fici (strain W106-1 / CGMCC3.15140) TaxID=1229662 RepID=W3XCX8_PESFW|nr:uncharacterized protein PFICI_05791 [Pestalotiopsis fici W106-1]ETS83915.1 hypothetical protein PFICI_05791 [Pestalotiopsis fici W106-1]
MGLTTRIKKDLELKNFTVHAQWLGMFAAVVHAIGALRLLYMAFKADRYADWWAGEISMNLPWSFRLAWTLTGYLNLM